MKPGHDPSQVMKGQRWVKLYELGHDPSLVMKDGRSLNPWSYREESAKKVGLGWVAPQQEGWR